MRWVQNDLCLLCGGKDDGLGGSRSFWVVDEGAGLAVQEQSWLQMDVCSFDNYSGVFGNEVQGRVFGTSAHAALIETCSDIASDLGFLLDGVEPFQIAELVRLGFEADLAKVYDAGRDGVIASMGFGRKESGLG